MRRWRLFLVGTVLVGAVCVGFLTLSGKLFSWAVREGKSWVRKETPYVLEVDQAHLRWFRELVVKRLSLTTQESGAAVVALQELHIKIRLLPLLRKKLVVDKLILIEPRLTVPLSIPSSGKSFDIGFLQVIHDFEIKGGSVTWVRADQSAVEFSPVNLQGHFADNKLDVDEFFVAWDRQSVKGKAEVFTRDLKQWDLEIQGEAQGENHSPVKGDFQAHMNVNKQTTHVTGVIQVEDKLVIDGSMDLAKDQGRTSFSFTGKTLQGDARATFDTTKKELQADFNLSVSQLSQLKAVYEPLGEWRGSAQSSGTLSGAWDHPLVKATLQTSDLRYGDIRLATVTAQMSTRAGSDPSFLLEVKTDRVQWSEKSHSPWDLENSSLRWEGNFQQARVQAQGLFKNQSRLSTQGLLNRSGNRLRFAWEDLKYVVASSQTFSVEAGGFLEKSPEQGFLITDVKIRQENGFLNLQHLSWRENQLGMKARAKEFSFETFFPVGGSSIPFRGFLSGAISLDGPLASPRGEFSLSVTSGALNDNSFNRLSLEGKIYDALIHFTQGRLDSTYAEEPLLCTGKLPLSWLVADAVDLPADLQLSFGPLDPYLWVLKIPEAETVKGGNIQFQGRLTGRRKDLSLEGFLKLSIPQLKIPTYGLDVQDMVLDIENKNQIFKIREGRAVVGKGSILISGESRVPHLQLAVVGNKIHFKNREIDFLGDVDLALSGTVDAPDFTGEVRIEKGSFEKKAKKKGEKAAPAPSAPSPTSESLRRRLKMDVHASWPNGVWYRDGLTKIESQADLHVLKDRGTDPIYLTGTLSLLRGSYDAYGKTFVIKSGELTFTGPPTINPNLQVVTEYKAKDAVVELMMTGTAEQPKITLTSDPPMTEQEILSLLVTGTPNIKGSDYEGEGSAKPGLDLAADVLSNYLTQEVRASGMNILSLDVMRVTPTEEGNMLTVGRYLGSRFFFSYSADTKNAANKVLNAEYILSPKWSLVGQTGSNTENYLDVQFRLPVARKKQIIHSP